MAYVSRTDSLRRAEGQERHQSPAARFEERPAQTGVIPAIGQRPAESARDRFAECREPIPECGHWDTPEPYAVRSVRCDARGFTFRSMTPGWRAGVVGGARTRHARCKTTKIPRGVAECLRDCLGQRRSPRIERPVLSTLRCTPLPVGTRGWYGAYPTTHGSPLPMNHRSRCVVNRASVSRLTRRPRPGMRKLSLTRLPNVSTSGVNCNRPGGAGIDAPGALKSNPFSTFRQKTHRIINPCCPRPRRDAAEDGVSCKILQSFPEQRGSAGHRVRDARSKKPANPREGSAGFMSGSLRRRALYPTELRGRLT
jgi:hypothetical protein